MTNYEIKMLDNINKKINYLMKEEKYNPYDISISMFSLTISILRTPA